MNARMSCFLFGLSAKKALCAGKISAGASKYRFWHEVPLLFYVLQEKIDTNV